MKGGADTGYTAYGELVKHELDVQDKRKASFEQRGLAVITTSGTIVTLLFALAALSTKESDTFTLPHPAQVWLSIGLVFFFVSALLALATNAPLRYQSVEVDGIKERLGKEPPWDSDKAAKDIALTRLKELRSAKKANTVKGWILVAAMVSEVLGVGCVAVAVSLIL